MEPFTLTHHENMGQILVTVTPTYNIKNDQQNMGEAIIVAYEQTDKPTTLIIDTRDMQVSWSDLIIGLSDSRTFAQFQHGHHQGTRFVVNKGLIATAIMALGQTQYGFPNIQVYDSLDEALAAA